MEQNYFSIGMLIFIFGSLLAVKYDMAKRPTFKEADDRYKDVGVCDEKHKNVDEKLDCIPEIKETVIEIKTKIDIFLSNR